jgi:uncharacterized protein (TIGR03382 family)
VKAAVGLLLCSGAAGAWEGHLGPDGQLQRFSFEKGPVQVALIDPPPGLRLKLGSDLRAALTLAAEAWQSVESAHVPVRYRGQIHPRLPLAGEVLISFDTEGLFPGNRDAAGFTELTVSGHQIASARVHLNARDFSWATDGSADALDVQSLAEHELGHALGLAHPCGDLDTDTPSCSALPPVLQAQLAADVMYASITPGPRRSLSQDDRDGITALLPAAAPPEIAPELRGILPECLQETQQIGPRLAQRVTVLVGRAPGALVLELLSSGALLAEVSLDRNAKGELSALVAGEALRTPGTLDARLVAQSGKAGVLYGALDVRDACRTHGCSSGGSSLLALLPVALFALRRRRLPALAALLGLAVCASPAHAYKRSINSGGLCIWWSARGHPFQIDAMGTPDVVGPAAFTAIRKSFQTWAGVSCSDLAFQDQGLSQDPKDRVVGYFAGQFNRNLVLFRTRNCKAVAPPGDACLTQGGCANLYDCWDHGDGVIATTTTTSNRFTGQINDSDIEINDAPGTGGSKFIFTAVDGSPCIDPNQTGCVRIDIQNTITHEAGHTIGLDHPPDPSATMYASAPEGETSKRNLGADDIQAICDIYPRGARTVTCDNDPITLTQTGSSNGGCGCSHSQTGPGATLGALVLVLGLIRLNRRARRVFL